MYAYKRADQHSDHTVIVTGRSIAGAHLHHDTCSKSNTHEELNIESDDANCSYDTPTQTHHIMSCKEKPMGFTCISCDILRARVIACTELDKVD